MVSEVETTSASRWVVIGNGSESELALDSDTLKEMMIIIVSYFYLISFPSSTPLVENANGNIKVHPFP